MEVSVDTVERELEQREARTLPMPAGVALGFGVCLMAFAAVMGAGLMVGLVNERGPVRMMLGLPLAFLFASFLLVGYGARGLFRGAQARKRAALHPAEPWYADWDWDPEGVAATGAGGGSFLGFILLGQVHTLWQYYLVKGGVLTLGMAGMGGMVANVVVSNWFVRRRGRAIAITAMGTSVAAIIIPSLAAQMIDAFGWRATFWLSAAVCALAIVLITVSVPRIMPVQGPRPTFGDITGNPALLRVLSLTLISFAATFTVVSFIGPVVTRTTGATGAGVGALQSFIGLGSMAGLAIGGILSDRGKGRSAQLAAFSVMALSLAAYSPALAAPTGSVPTVAMGALIFVGATALFLLIPVNLADIALRAGTAAPIALAFNGSLVSLGQGAGAVLGGQLTDAFGAAAMGVGGAALALTGLGVALSSNRMSNKTRGTTEA